MPTRHTDPKTATMRMEISMAKLSCACGGEDTLGSRRLLSLRQHWHSRVCVCAILEMLQLHHPYLGRRQIKQRPIAACGLSPRALNGFRSERRLCSNCHSAFPCLRFHIIGCWTLSGIKALKCWLWCCKRSGIFCMESLLSRNELLCRELGVGRCVTFC